MKIPLSFNLFGSRITIEFDNNRCAEENAYGLSLLKQNRIYLADFSDGVNLQSTEIECTFLHETVHFILTRLGYEDLSKDENFIKQFSNTLHQCLTTQKY